MSNKNATIVETQDHVFLFSYSTPVVTMLKHENKVLRTATHYSTTTTKHINQYLAALPAEHEIVVVDQSIIDAIAPISVVRL